MQDEHKDKNRVDYFPTLKELHYIQNYDLGDTACLSVLFSKYKPICRICEDSACKWYRVETRTAYSSACGHQFFPMAHTIFEKSTNGLRVWFDVIADIYVTNGKIPIKELQRKYKVTYKTAWRMKHLILDYLGIQLPKYGGFSYQYSSATNGRYSQADYRRKHGLTEKQL